MSRILPKVLLGGFSVLFVILVWLTVSEGLLESNAALDERAATLPDGPLDEPPFEAEDQKSAEASVDGSEPEDPDKRDPNAPSMGLGGTVRIAAQDLTVFDKRGRRVLKAKLARTTAKLAAMRDGKILVPEGLVEGAELSLYRDAEGQISITSVLRTAPPAVRRSLALPPVSDETTPESWILSAGPIAIRDSVLSILFIERPVKIRVDSGTVRVEQGRKETKPRLYFDEIEGALLEPSPLPKPIRIAYAKGLVRLVGDPLVELAARTCIGHSELRIHALVPARKQAVQITGDSAGLGGALGRMGLKIAGKKKADKLVFHKGPVKLDGGPLCKESRTHNRPKR